MVKIRLQGLPDDVQRLIEMLRTCEAVGDLLLLSVSDPYPNRGDSKYVRVYVDASVVE